MMLATLSRVFHVGHVILIFNQTKIESSFASVFGIKDSKQGDIRLSGGKFGIAKIQDRFAYMRATAYISDF